jgi:hypothetical protein
MVKRLKQQHALGKKLKRTRENGQPIPPLAGNFPYSDHTLRKIRLFAEKYTDGQLEELCLGRRENGLPLHWGYIPVLLSVGIKRGVKIRTELQRQAIENGWSVAELRRAVRQKISFKGHGRAMAVPQDVNAAMLDLAENVEFLKRRCTAVMRAARAKRNSRVYERSRRLRSALSRAAEIVGK